MAIYERRSDRARVLVRQAVMPINEWSAVENWLRCYGYDPEEVEPQFEEYLVIDPETKELTRYTDDAEFSRDYDDITITEDD